jgi:hypothetical protein
MTTEFWLKLAGIFLGVMARLLIPWIRKLQQGEKLKFDPRYLYSSLGSFVLGVILTLVLFPRFEPSAAASSAAASASALSPGLGFEAGFKLFCLAFGFGFGWNAIVIEAGKWAQCFTDDGAAPEQEQGKGEPQA